MHMKWNGCLDALHEEKLWPALASGNPKHVGEYASLDILIF